MPYGEAGWNFHFCWFGKYKFINISYLVLYFFRFTEIGSWPYDPEIAFS